MREGKLVKALLLGGFKFCTIKLQNPVCLSVKTALSAAKATAERFITATSAVIALPTCGGC